jgi:hypothetical protein
MLENIYPTKSYVKNALVQPEPRALFRRLLDQGWIDAIRALHPDEPMYTFWDIRVDRLELPAYPKQQARRPPRLVACRSECQVTGRDLQN